jgi:hypothetical protein
MVPTSPGLARRSSLYYGSPFEAASAGLGGMLRELGHAFGCIPEPLATPVRDFQGTSP